MQTMTRDQFIAYAHEVTSGEALEPLYEQLAEHEGEIARFGDAGPGRTTLLLEACREVRAIERQLARLERRQERDFRLAVRSPR
jgi:hypothetical protein